MKTTRLSFALLCASAALFSCTKEKADSSDLYDPARYLTGFKAEIEDIGTKATIDLDARTVSWEAGDEVLVTIPESSAQGVYRYDATRQLFIPLEGEQPLQIEGGSLAYLYYPAAHYTVGTNAVVYKLPAAVSDVADLGDKNPMASAFQFGTDETAVFRNIASILRLRLTGARTVSSVVLSNDDVAIAANSEFVVTSWNGDVPSVTATEKTMTIDGPVALNEDSPTDFFFLLPPSTASMSNLKVTVTLATADAGGETSVILTRPDAMPLSANKIIKMSFYAGLFSGGEGTETAPYKIATVRDFLNIGAYTTSGYGTLTAAHFFEAHYVQAADIDFGGASLTKIGKYVNTTDFSKAFKGVYDGNGKKLASFTITDDGAQGLGLFSAVENATLKNMVVEDITVNSTSSYVGGIVAFAKGSTIENCSLSGTVQSIKGATGGIVGYIYQGGTVSKCSVHDITLGFFGTSGGNNFGGIVGYIPNNGTTVIEDCHTLSGSLDSGANFQVGGILGGNANATVGAVTITGCTNAATIKGAGKAGGINGYSVAITLEDCTNEGAVTVNSSGTTNNDRYAGGISALITNGTIEACVNKGTVTSNKTFCGGILGNTTGALTITKCINEGTVNSSNSNSGGIVGYLQGTSVISLCVNKGDYVQGSARVGGLVGNVNNANAWIINSVSTAKVIATANVTAVADGSNGAVGGLVGTVTAGHLANCVHGDNYVINRKGSTASNQGFVCLGGVVGHASGANALVQNCYTVRACDKMGVYATGEELTFASSDPGSTHMGQVYGYIEKGTVKDCYAINDATAGCSFGTNAATVSNVTVMGGGEAQGYLNHHYNTLVTAPDGTTATALTVSGGTAFDVTATYPVAILNGGASLISGYSDSEALQWEEVAALGDYPLPSALVALGPNYTVL